MFSAEKHVVPPNAPVGGEGGLTGGVGGLTGAGGGCIGDGVGGTVGGVIGEITAGAGVGGESGCGVGGKRLGFHNRTQCRPDFGGVHPTEAHPPAGRGGMSAAKEAVTARRPRVESGH